MSIRPLPGFDGCLLRLGSRGTIICNSQTTHRGRRRFTIAHELGHWFLHPSHGQDLLLGEDKAARYNKSDWMEVEANTFASELLMPRKWFGLHVRNAEPLIETIIDAADDFEVSIMAATKRFLSLTHVPSMAVFSDGYEVKWVWQSRGSDIFLKVGTDVSPASTAYECDSTPEDAAKLGPLEGSGDDWFPDDWRNERITVREQSCLLYKDIVLSLLQVDVLPV